jgi:hypothetical protein
MGSRSSFETAVKKAVKTPLLKDEGTACRSVQKSSFGPIGTIRLGFSCGWLS